MSSHLVAKTTGESSGLLSKVTKLVGKSNKDSSGDQQSDDKKDKEKGRSQLKHSKADEFVISSPTSKQERKRKKTHFCFGFVR